MASAALGRMLGVLTPLRLYNLAPGSLVSAELMAYDAAFLLLEQELADTLRSAFVQTARGNALRSFERLVGLPLRADMSDETRRELVIYRTSIAPYGFTAAGMRDSMRAAGIEAELAENPAGESLVVKSVALIDPALTIDMARSRLEALVPAHLDWELDFGFTTWLYFDGLERTFTQLDALDAPWDELDARLQNL